MATTKLHQIKNTENRALGYVMNDKKTENGNLVYSYSCSKDPLQAAKDFQAVRDRFQSHTKILSHHLIQSFKPGEVTPCSTTAPTPKMTAKRFLRSEEQERLPL